MTTVGGVFFFFLLRRVLRGLWHILFICCSKFFIGCLKGITNYLKLEVFRTSKTCPKTLAKVSRDYYNLLTRIFYIKSTPVCQVNTPNHINFQPFGAVSVDLLNCETTSSLWLPTQNTHLYEPTIFLRPHWTRFMFRGKAFRLRYYKKLNRFFFNLGFSHVTRLFLGPAFLGARKPRPRERTRQRYAIFSYNFYQITMLQAHTRVVKPYNVYTQRGLRLRAQGIGRRFGKISQHISSLH